MLIFFYILTYQDERMSPALNEWLLSSVRGDTGSNPEEALIFLQASHFL